MKVYSYLPWIVPSVDCRTEPKPAANSRRVCCHTFARVSQARIWSIPLAAFPIGALVALGAAYATSAFLLTAIAISGIVAIVVFWRRIAYLVDARMLLLLLFLLAGYFKADPRLAWLPFDLTLAAGAGAAAMATISFFRFGPPPVMPTALLFGLFAVYAIPLAWTDFTPEAEDKVARLFTLTLAAPVFALLLVRSPDDTRRFMNCIVLAGLIMAVDAVLAFPDASLQPVIAFSSNTIALGRATGSALIWVFIAALVGRLKVLLALPLIGLCAVALASSGSRGPALTTMGIVVVVVLIAGKGWRRIAMGTIVALALGAAAWLAPDVAVERIGAFLGGSLGHSESLRLEAYQESVRVVAENPLGVGWASFGSYVGIFYEAARQYPHNLLLEVAVEAGWLAGAATVAVLSWALLRAFRNRGNAEGLGVFALLAFLTANAMVSGDVNDNRVLLAFVAIALAGSHRLREPAAKTLATESPRRIFHRAQ